MASYELPNYMNNNQFISTFNNINFIEPNTASDIASSANINYNTLDARYLSKIQNDTSFYNLTANKLKSSTDLDVTNLLTVTGNTDLKQALTVTGVTTLNNNLNVMNNLVVTGNTDLKQTLTVTGITTLNNNLNVMNNLVVTGNTDLKQNLNVTGITTLNNNIVLSSQDTFNLDTLLNNKTISPQINSRFTYVNKPSSSDTGNGTFFAEYTSVFSDPSPVAYTANREFYILQGTLLPAGVGVNEAQGLTVEIEYYMFQSEIVPQSYSYCEHGTCAITLLKQYNGVDSSPTGYYTNGQIVKLSNAYRGQSNFKLYYDSSSQTSSNNFAIVFNSTGGGADARVFSNVFKVKVSYQGNTSSANALTVFNSLNINLTRTVPAWVSSSTLFTPSFYSRALARFKQTTAQTTGITTKCYLAYQSATINKWWTVIAPYFYNSGQTYLGLGFPVTGLYKVDVFLKFTNITGNKYISIGYDYFDATTNSTKTDTLQTVITPQISTGYNLSASFYITAKTTGLSQNTAPTPPASDYLRVFVLTEVSESLTSSYVMVRYVDDTSIDIFN